MKKQLFYLDNFPKFLFFSFRRKYIWWISKSKSKFGRRQKSWKKYFVPFCDNFLFYREWERKRETEPRWNVKPRDATVKARPLPLYLAATRVGKPCQLLAPSYPLVEARVDVTPLYEFLNSKRLPTLQSPLLLPPSLFARIDADKTSILERVCLSSLSLSLERERRKQ